jgi:predicted dehydrogenase
MINVGIIGMGRSGWELHAVPLRKFPKYKLVAVCDQSEKRRSEAARTFEVQAFSHWQELIEDNQIDLVVVCTPSHLHVEPTIAGLEAGKHVLVEKPMAVSLSDAEKMVAVAERTGKILTVFHNRHWDRDYQMVKKIVRENLLGEILTLDSRVMTYGPEWANYGVPEFDPHWRTKAFFGGGFLADWGPHLVEQVLDLTEEWPESVVCELRSHLWATEVDDYFHLRLSFPSGLLVTLEGSNNARLPLPRWFVVGRRGTLIADGSWGRWTDMHIHTAIEDMAVDISPQNMGPSSTGKNYDVGEELSACFYEDLSMAIEANCTPAVSMVRARDVMAVLEAAKESARLGGGISLRQYKKEGVWSK